MLKATGDVETGLRSLIRGAIAAASHVPHLARLAERVQDLLHPPPSPAEAAPSAPQLALWVVDDDGLPPRPWKVYPGDRFVCVKLGGENIDVACCAARQIANDLQRTQQTSRGQGTDYPSCNSATCAQGRGIRAAIGAADVAWRGSGAGWLARFQREKSKAEKARQRAAQRRQERQGELDEVRVLDVHADPVPEVDEEHEAVGPKEEASATTGDASEDTP